MTTDLTIERLYRVAALDSEQEALGSVSQVYTDEAGQPSCVEVAHGVFGMGSSRVPVHGSKLTGGQLALGFPEDIIRDVPHHEPGKELAQEREQEILRSGLRAHPVPRMSARAFCWVPWVRMNPPGWPGMGPHPGCPVQRYELLISRSPQTLPPNSHPRNRRRRNEIVRLYCGDGDSGRFLRSCPRIRCRRCHDRLRDIRTGRRPFRGRGGSA